MSAAANEEHPDKKQKTDNVVWPTIDGVVKICDGVEKPILQTLATVCAKLYDEALFAAWTPMTPTDGSDPVNGFQANELDQPYELSKPGGQYSPKGGTYYTGKDGKAAYTNGTGDVVEGVEIFNEDTTKVIEGKPYGTQSLASYGKVVAGFTDFYGMDQAAIPPFAALVVQPNDEQEAPILILAWRGSTTVLDWVNDVAFSPTLSSRWSGETDKVRAHGAYTNLVEDTFSRHEVAIVALFEQFPKVKCAYITGHSLGGGIANVAHLVVRGQLALAKAGPSGSSLLGPASPWHEHVLDKVTWLACTFASPQTLVRKYKPDDIPPLVAELDASSYNLVYECDIFPRILGMLKFLGDFVETLAPEIADSKLNESVDKLGFVARHAVQIGLNFIKPEKELENKGKEAVKFFKNKGLSEVVAQFTHTGTVVYLAPEAENYVYLLGKTDIHKVLDVDGKDFTALFPGDPKDYVTLLAAAHGHSYDKFVYGAK